MNFKDYFKQHLINEMAMAPKYFDEREKAFHKMIHLDRAKAYDIRDETKRMTADPTTLHSGEFEEKPIDGLTIDDMLYLHMAHNNPEIKIPQDTLDKVKRIIDNHGHFVGRHPDVANDSATYPTFHTNQEHLKGRFR